MKPNANGKKSIDTSVTFDQKELMYNLFSPHDYLIRYFKGTLQREMFTPFWNTVANRLNSVQGGAIKTWREWALYWIDYKRFIRKKLRTYKAAQERTGLRDPPGVTPLDDLEKNFLLYLGNYLGSIPWPEIDYGPEYSDDDEFYIPLRYEWQTETDNYTVRDYITANTSANALIDEPPDYVQHNETSMHPIKEAAKKQSQPIKGTVTQAQPLAIKETVTQTQIKPTPQPQAKVMVTNTQLQPTKPTQAQVQIKPTHTQTQPIKLTHTQSQIKCTLTPPQAKETVSSTQLQPIKHTQEQPQVIKVTHSLSQRIKPTHTEPRPMKGIVTHTQSLPIRPSHTQPQIKVRPLTQLQPANTQLPAQKEMVTRTEPQLVKPTYSHPTVMKENDTHTQTKIIKEATLTPPQFVKGTVTHTQTQPIKLTHTQPQIRPTYTQPQLIKGTVTQTQIKPTPQPQAKETVTNTQLQPIKLTQAQPQLIKGTVTLTQSQPIKPTHTQPQPMKGIVTHTQSQSIKPSHTQPELIKGTVTHTQPQILNEATPTPPQVKRTVTHTQFQPIKLTHTKSPMMQETVHTLQAMEDTHTASTSLGNRRKRKVTNSRLTLELAKKRLKVETRSLELAEAQAKSLQKIADTLNDIKQILSRRTGTSRAGTNDCGIL